MKCDELKVHKAYNRWIDEEMPTPNDDLICNEVYLKSEADKVIEGLQEKLKEQTSIAEEGWKEFRTYHTSYAEAVKELYDKNKEIAELKEKHKTEVKELLCLIRDKENNFNRAFDSEEKEIRHQKYKRCLAMAKECEATALWCYQSANTLPTGFHAKLFGKPVMIEPDRLYNRFERLIKWNNRWLKIAEQFKEAK